MAANLAASHLTDFILVLAPQVGLEPTTLRLTVAFGGSIITSRALGTTRRWAADRTP